jgi:hypothetical protein
MRRSNRKINPPTAENKESKITVEEYDPILYKEDLAPKIHLFKIGAGGRP